MMGETLKIIRSPDTLRTQRVPPGQRLVDKLPVLHYRQTMHISPANWSLTISGLVKQEITLNFQQFTALPQVKLIADIHCVTDWSILNTIWEGVSTSELKHLVQILPAAKFVMLYSADGYYTNLSLEDFFAEDVILAMKFNEATLTPEYGYPVRLIVPRLYFWKSAKWVKGIKFMANNQPGFWESRGYHNHGDPWLEERYS